MAIHEWGHECTNVPVGIRGLIRGWLTRYALTTSLISSQYPIRPRTFHEETRHSCIRGAQHSWMAPRYTRVSGSNSFWCS
jgi:hypothetical protein